MKIRVWATSTSNASYRAEDIYECDYTREEWDKLNEHQQNSYLDTEGSNFMANDIDFGAEVIDE